MYLINTSYGWNPGDDLIREGVINILGLQEASKVFVNRAQLIIDGNIVPQWKTIRNNETPDELGKIAKAIIMAGSPEWLDFFEEFYEVAVKYQLPIYFVGVGMKPGAKNTDALLQSVKHLVKGATVRDNIAASTLKRHSIETTWFPDPAFSASYEIPPIKKYELVVNYRSCGGNGNFKPDFDDAWSAVQRAYSSDISLVTVHEQGEYAKAKSIFKAPVFYSSDYLDYKRIYANTRVYLGGRIHGATPVLACGGTAYVLYNSSKIQALSKVAEFMDTLYISKYSDTIPSLEYKDSTNSLAKLKNRISAHMKYWGDR